jgi:hypothetical protein
MDSTNNWWAITKPFSDRFRLVVNGDETDAMLDIKRPVFSPDSERWAAYVRDNTGWYVIDENHFYPINTQITGEIVYSRNSDNMAFSYLLEDFTVISMPDTTINVPDMVGSYYLSDDGNDLAYLQRNGDMYAVKTLDWESTYYQEIKLIGIWHTGKPVYAALAGNQWVAMIGDKEITEPFVNITSLRLNLAGDVLAFSALRPSGRAIAVMYSDDYIDIFRSKEYDNVSDLSLHPYLPIILFRARQLEVELIVQNDTEFWGGEEVGTPQFSFDGSEISYLGCNVNCFLILNGVRHSFGMDMGTDFDYAAAPGTETIAFPSNAGLNVLNLETGLMSLGRMMDNAFGVRYNRFDGVYQSLGTINGRLYLLSCKPK